MKGVAKGSFEVTTKSEPVSDMAGPAGIARMSLDKSFAGDLLGTSVGEMLSTMGSDRALPVMSPSSAFGAGSAAAAARLPCCTRG